MYRADSTKSSVELPELCFDGMNISCHQLVEIIHDFIRGAAFSHADNHAHSIIEGKFAKMLTGEIMTGILGKEPMMIRHILNNRVKILFTFDGKLFIIEMCGHLVARRVTRWPHIFFVCLSSTNIKNFDKDSRQMLQKY